VSDKGELEVRGGAGGVSARLEDLERAGALLRSVAEHLADHCRVVLAVSADPRLRRTAQLSVVTFARAEAALLAAGCGSGGLLAVAARMQALGTGALAAADGYRRADAAVSGALQATGRAAGRTVGLALGIASPGLLITTGLTVIVLNGQGDSNPTAGDSPGRALPEPLRRIGELTLRLLADQAALTELAVGLLPGLVSGFTSVAAGPLTAARVFGDPGGPRTVAEVAAGLEVIGGRSPRLAGVTGGRSWFQETQQVRLRVTSTPPSRPATGTADLLGRIPVSSAEPVVHVEQVNGPTGRHWVVSIPGTTDWSPVAGRTPFDLTGDVRLMAGERSAGMAGVVAAMRATGVRSGEPVLLVGHSQGGLIAAAVAADPAVRREFTVTHVLTSGAPVASVPVPDDVQVLSLEHTDDLVPRLDGSANPDRSKWITVSAPAPAPADAAARSEPLLAHRGELYRSTAERVDRSSDPSLAVWRAGLVPFLDPAPGPDTGTPASGAGWDVRINRVGTP
jgi:hypothetical protein